MDKIVRGSKAGGKEAIFVAKKTGEVFISEGSFPSINKKHGDCVKAGNLLHTQELFVADAVLYKSTNGGSEYTPFAEIAFNSITEEFWVVRYASIVELSKPEVCKCKHCGTNLDTIYNVASCYRCGAPVVYCDGCVYKGLNDDMCKQCTLGSVYAPRSL